jgi:pimeloyl-ACP methyl ester carboxylesterase
VHYLEAGTGDPPVVLLHAFPLHAAMWTPQLEELCEEWRVIAPDLPGGPSMDAMADAVADLVEDLGVGPVVIGGLSMGGYVTFAFLRRHRRLARATVLADTRPGPDTDEIRTRRSRQQAQVREEGTAALVDSMVSSLLSEHTRTTRPDVVDNAHALMADVDPEHIVAHLEAMKHRPDSTPDLAGLDLPALVVVGGDDQVSPPDVAAQMRDRLPNAQLTVIPDAGHLSSLEAPDAFNAALRAFLDQLA